MEHTSKRYRLSALAVIVMMGLFWLFSHYVLDLGWWKATIANPMNSGFVGFLSVILVVWLVNKKKRDSTT